MSICSEQTTSQVRKDVFRTPPSVRSLNFFTSYIVILSVTGKDTKLCGVAEGVPTCPKWTLFGLDAAEKACHLCIDMSIRSLLHYASLAQEREKTARAEAFRRGESFNVFRLCRVDHYETLHSAILAEWLDPKGSHGQGNLFLKLFLQRLDTEDLSDFHTETASVFTEFVTEEGRLDILLTDGAGAAVIIENKIYASDQDRQLRRYSAYAKSRTDWNRHAILYLTLYGDEASLQSGEGVRYDCISYETTVLDWLGDCAKEVCDKPFLRETLAQYQGLIRQLTGKDMVRQTDNELLSEMLRNPEGVAAIIKAQNDWERTILEDKLIMPLKRFAEERGLRFSVNDKFWSKSAWGRLEFELAPKLKIVFENEHQGRYSFYYGIVDTRENRPGRKKLPGLEGGNDGWPYGWHYLDGEYRNWTVDFIVNLACDNGPVLEYICRAVDMMVGEINNNQIF